jgi:S-DNA-T family DNA segregation ATPase FtsK/SpoIIIE
MSTAVAVKTVPAWMLWLDADPIKLSRWGKFVWLPLLGYALRWLVLRPVKLGVAAFAGWLWSATNPVLPLVMVIGLWAWDRWSSSRGVAASGRVARAYQRCQVRGKIRQNWRRLLVRSRISADGIGIPRHGFIRATDTGLKLRVRHGEAGVAIADMRERLPLVTGMVGHLHSIRLRERNPDYCEWYVNLVNPLRGTIPAAAMPVAAFPKVTLGRAAEGHWYQPTILGLHIKIVGQSGAGKSSLIWDIIRGAEQWDMPPEWYVIDKPGGIELPAMDRALGGIATEYERDPRLADKLFQKMAEEAERRNEIMRRNHWKRWSPERAEALGPLVIGLTDELLALPPKATKAGSHLRHLLQVGRASGVQLVANTQLPQRDQDGLGRLADLFSGSFVGATDSPGMTASALGDSAVSQAPAHELTLPTDAGIFFAKEEGVTGYTKFKAGFVDDDHGEQLPIARGELRKPKARFSRALEDQLSFPDITEAIR